MTIWHPKIVLPMADIPFNFSCLCTHFWRYSIACDYSQSLFVFFVWLFFLIGYRPSATNLIIWAHGGIMMCEKGKVWWIAHVILTHNAESWIWWSALPLKFHSYCEEKHPRHISANLATWVAGCGFNPLQLTYCIHGSSATKFPNFNPFSLGRLSSHSDLLYSK